MTSLQPVAMFDVDPAGLSGLICRHGEAEKLAGLQPVLFVPDQSGDFGRSYFSRRIAQPPHKDDLQTIFANFENGPYAVNEYGGRIFIIGICLKPNHGDTPPRVAAHIADDAGSFSSPHLWWAYGLFLSALGHNVTCSSQGKRSEKFLACKVNDFVLHPLDAAAVTLSASRSMKGN